MANSLEQPKAALVKKTINSQTEDLKTLQIVFKLIYANQSVSFATQILECDFIFLPDGLPVQGTTNDYALEEFK